MDQKWIRDYWISLNKDQVDILTISIEFEETNRSYDSFIIIVYRSNIILLTGENFI